MKLSDEDADKMISDILSRIEASLKIKAREYVRNQDRMHNFNVGSKIKDKLREEIIEDFRLKHEVSRMDLINDLKGNKTPSLEYVSEKYGDIINYFILEEMSIRHRILIKEQTKQEVEN